MKRGLHGNFQGSHGSFLAWLFDPSRQESQICPRTIITIRRVQARYATAKEIKLNLGCSVLEKAISTGNPYPGHRPLSLFLRLSPRIRPRVPSSESARYLSTNKWLFLPFEPRLFQVDSRGCAARGGHACSSFTRLSFLGTMAIQKRGKAYSGTVRRLNILRCSFARIISNHEGQERTYYLHTHFS